MKLDKRLSRLMPVGCSWKTWAAVWLLGAATAFLWGFVAFAMPYQEVRRQLFDVRRQLISGRYMVPFPALLRGTSTGFLILALCMPFQALEHYLRHFQGSRSIYLMRRLPQRWELARRCLSFPLAGLVLCAVAYGLTILFCYIYYMVQTPAVCLPPDIWARMGG